MRVIRHQRVIAGLALMIGLVFAVAVAVGVDAVTKASPGELTKSSKRVRHFEYVVVDGEISVYDIDRSHRLVQVIRLPRLQSPHGIVAHPPSGMLYVAYGGQDGENGHTGSVLAYDLIRGRTVWRRDYATGIDSIAITPNGKTLYLPAGESSVSKLWYLVDPTNGAVKGSIKAGAGPHNTVMSIDGKSVFLAGTMYPYLAMASTSTNKVVRWIGPLVSGGRPFTINGRKTLAFTTGRPLLGFQVSSTRTGKVLYTVHVPGYSYDPEAFNHRTACHGISMSPDEREIYLIDTPNGYVHVFDIRRVPASPPRYVTSIKLAHPPPNDGWLQHSRNGRYVYVGRAGDVIDTRTRKIVAYLPPMDNSATFLEIDWRSGRPVASTTRYGRGYVRPR
jgi:hypothetical protein